MKKIILGLLIFTLFTTSCSSNDDNGLAVTKQNLLGKWYLKGGTINNGSFQNHEHDCSTSKDFQEFFDNDILTFNGYNTACDLNEVEASNWILNGNILTVSNTNFDPMIYEYEYEIEELTSEELILKQTVTEPEGTSVVKTTFTRE